MTNTKTIMRHPLLAGPGTRVHTQRRKDKLKNTKTTMDVPGTYTKTQRHKDTYKYKGKVMLQIDIAISFEIASAPLFRVWCWRRPGRQSLAVWPSRKAGQVVLSIIGKRQLSSNQLLTGNLDNHPIHPGAIPCLSACLVIDIASVQNQGLLGLLPQLLVNFLPWLILCPQCLAW